MVGRSKGSAMQTDPFEGYRSLLFALAGRSGLPPEICPGAIGTLMSDLPQTISEVCQLVGMSQMVSPVDNQLLSLNLSRSSIDGMGPDPPIDTATIVPDQEPALVNRLDQVQIDLPFDLR
jgi:hypothetical protein